MKGNFAHRIYQIIGFLLGARFFVMLLLAFALYVSTFFLLNQEQRLSAFVFDYKVHGIIFCALLSILAGGIINQFYDKEKDKVATPFRSRLQNFIAQRYFLSAYSVLVLVSLIFSCFLSWRVFVFYFVYQFFMWFYSHKLSKIIAINNISFVCLTLYPFFGMVVYYRNFSYKLLFLALYLFVSLLLIDVLKDCMTKKIDQVFGYSTFANTLAPREMKAVFFCLYFLQSLFAIVVAAEHFALSVICIYFIFGIFISISCLFLSLGTRKRRFMAMNILRIWIFIGILVMLITGIHNYYL